MGILSAEALLKEVQEKGEAKLRELEEEYRNKISDLESSIEAEITRIQQSNESQINEQTQRVRSLILSSARLEAKRTLLNAQEEYVRAALDKLRAILADYSDTEEYVRTLSAMTEYARSKLGDLLVKCREKDATFFKSKKIKVVDSSLQSIGGAIYLSSDEKMEMDLTFEELLRVNEDKVRAAIIANLEKD
ncbi:MAG: V-type ATP synthase subunit E family protein [Thermoprotei archaeon]